MRLFKETQRFNQWWVQLINLGVLVILGRFVFGWYFQGKTVDKIGPDNLQGQLLLAGPLLLTFVLLYLFNLKTEVDENGIHYRLFPFHTNFKHVSWYDIQECYVRKYNPIKEYGGWGIKIVPFKNNKAYTTRGSMGIQIVLKNGKKILIGTQKSDEAQNIINKYFKTDK